MDSIVTLTVVLDIPLYRRLCRLASATGRSTSWVVDRALRSYVEGELDKMEEVSSNAEDRPIERHHSPRRRTAARPTDKNGE
jgi:predicted transcriptional regulator